MDESRNVVVVGYPGAELLDIACVVSAMQIANHLHRQAVYHVAVASPGGEPIETGSGLTLNAQLELEQVRGPLDTLVVSGGLGYVDAMDDRVLVAHVRRLGRETRRLASVCTGAGILAAAGLLDGRRAATHWEHADLLAARFPAVHFDSAPIFISDEHVSTSAGVTASLDLTLSFIEADAGPELARDVARRLVTYLQRPGNQAQMSMFTAAPAPRHALLRDAAAYIAGHLDADLSVSTLAARAGVSERHLARMFLCEFGVTPGRFVRRARAEAAAHLLTGTDLTVEAVAARSGFRSAESLRQAFQSIYGVSPSLYRGTQSHGTPAGPTPTANDEAHAPSATTAAGGRRPPCLRPAWRPR